jgi:hypothetical protein
MSAVDQLLGRPAVAVYLDQCQVRSPLVEVVGDVHVPPTGTEARELIAYLRKLHLPHALAPVIVGSTAVLHYVKDTARFRPTMDLDLHVRLPQAEFRKVRPPKGWHVDPESVGVVSWVSPGGGRVDFLCADDEFPGSERVPHRVTTDSSSHPDYPVATADDLFRLKLNSMRTKDTLDLIAFARTLKRVPTEAELGPLNDTQRDNLEMVRTWYERRPMGTYGE